MILLSPQSHGPDVRLSLAANGKPHGGLEVPAHTHFRLVAVKVPCGLRKVEQDRPEAVADDFADMRHADLQNGKGP